jgi:hypothetical protein
VSTREITEWDPGFTERLVKYLVYIDFQMRYHPRYRFCGSGGGWQRGTRVAEVTAGRR